MTKIYKHRKLHGLEKTGRTWLQLGHPDSLTLSESLESVAKHNAEHPAARIDQICVCGSLDQMPREYMTEPLAEGWRFGREFVFKDRTAVYVRPEKSDREIAVKLISHRNSWLPDCESMLTAIPAWRALESEWAATGLPLLSSPAATGKALLWETLPRDREGNPIEYPALDDDLARLIRANSPQHRLEMFNNVAHLDWFKAGADPAALYQYDGRWMYASLCGLDRLPVGTPKRIGGFKEYTPGLYFVTVKIPDSWNRIGLIPVKDDMGAWLYPNAAGSRVTTWAFEPELTLALKHGWEIVAGYDGYVFDKGRPLAGWSDKLIKMRERLGAPVKFEDQERCANARKFAAAAVRQILNHTIGAIHKNEYERETIIPESEFRQWRRENPHLAESEQYGWARIEGGYRVPYFAPDNGRLSIFMPHWSATLYSLARARVADWALRCDSATLVKIHGDAIYSTVEQPELDALNTGRLGQPRRK